MDERPTSGRRRAPRRARRRVSALTVVALVLLTGGLGLLGWVGYQYLGTDIVAQKAFDSERNDLRTRWSQAPTTTTGGSGSAETTTKTLPGEAIALLRIPAFGADFEVPILAGTDLSFLDRGVGHYEGTALPGQVGNFAVAGHRITHGQPFGRLLELDRGDQIVVETRTAVLTYVMDAAPRSLTVQDTDTWVLDPVPGEPGAEPTKKLMTLTTCQDLFRSPDRSVGFAHLESTTNKG